MRVVEMAVVRNCEVEADADTVLKVRKDDNGYSLIVSAQGSRINAVVIRGLNELQVRTLASEIVLKV